MTMPEGGGAVSGRGGAGAAGGVRVSGPQQPGYAGDVTPLQAWRMLEEDPHAMLVDVRTSAEWHYVGAPDLTVLGRRTRFVEWIDFPGGMLNPRFDAQLRAAVGGAGAGADASAAGGPSGTDVGPVLFICRSGQRSIGAAIAATNAGLVPAYNILDGFEGSLDADGHRGASGWRAAGLPWCQS